MPHNRILLRFARARQTFSDYLTAIGWSRPACVLASGVTNRELGARALILIAIIATALVTGMSVPDQFGNNRLASWSTQLQQAEKFQNRVLTIIVASTIYAEPSEPWPVLVEIDPSRWAPSDSVLHVRGLPPTAFLSEGYRLSSGVWLLPIVGLSNLEIHVPTGVSEQSELTFTLVRTDGSVLAKAHAVLSILEPVSTTAAAAAVVHMSTGDINRGAKEAESSPSAAMATSAPATPAALAPPEKKNESTASLGPSPATAPEQPLRTATTIPAQQLEHASKMLVRGKHELDNGNISAARQFFRRAAEAGLAIGAFLLASTYDSHELGGQRILGVQPDHAVAERWYKRAEELGAPRAKERLLRLSAGN